jgi:predicted DNA-binding protein with PD1-like motif
VLDAPAVNWTVHPTDKARHIVLRASAGETIPAALVAMLSQEAVACGWLRASGVLQDVELRAFDPQVGGLGSARRIAGPVQVLSLDGSIGLARGEPSVALRALLARETDRGLETLAGEIASATTIALEVLVTALDDLTLVRELDEAAGLAMLAPPEGIPRVAVPKPAPAWSGALAASDRAEPRPRPSPAQTPTTSEAAVMPARPARPAVDFDVVYPEPGDVVEHFAFGPADVVKSDGDRLHLKVHKDSRVREIALEMLRVSRLGDTDDGKRRFRLERRM